MTLAPDEQDAHAEHAPPTPTDPAAESLERLVRMARWFLTICGVLLALACLHIGRDLLIPIAVAILIWFLINALANGLTGPPGRPGLPLGLAKLLAVAIFFGLMMLAGRIVADNAAALGEDLDIEGSALLAQARALAHRVGLPETVDANWLRGQVLLSEMPGQVLDTMRGLVSDASLIFLYVLFLLLDERFFDAKLRALIPVESRRRGLSALLNDTARDARVYLWLMFLISLGVGVATFAFCQAFGVAGAGFWGFVAFVLNFIPTIGSVLGVLFPFLYALITFDDPWLLLGLGGSLAATQFVAGEVVLPRVMGDSLNLSSFVILFALVLWGLLWGPVGMFLAIPVTVILTSVCAKFPAARPVAILLSKDGRLPEP